MIINFHNVVAHLLNEYDLHAAPRIDVQQFTSAIDWLSQRFEFISLNELLLRVKQNTSTDQSVALTFDDGYCGVLRYAFPILKSRGINASVMVVTQTLASSSKLFHFEELEMAFRISQVDELKLPTHNGLPLKTLAGRIACLKQLKKTLKLQPESMRHRNHALILAGLDVTPEQLQEAAKDYPIFDKLDRDQLRFLAEEGWSIGAHTRSHRTLSCLHDDDAKDEIMGSLEDIAACFGFAGIPFAYPYGGPQHIGDRVFDWMEDSGYSCGLTTTLRIESPGTDLFRLRRINIEDFCKHQPNIFDGN